ncbi:MAG TPA: hypothetical protein VGV69_09380 [Solirubrobacterales bacterium]|nr:hypothetical protein [Solirubrobacterales bacterium]
MTSPHLERALVRVLVGTALVAALWACALVPVPLDAQGGPDLPSLAFGQPGLYRLEVALLVFYGSLLLITPAFSGLARGRLPIEISMRGAKFAEGADSSAEVTQTTIAELEQTTTYLADALTRADIEIGHLKEQLNDDSEG